MERGSQTSKEPFGVGQFGLVDTENINKDPAPPVTVRQSVSYTLKCLDCSEKAGKAGLNITGVSKEKKKKKE